MTRIRHCGRATGALRRTFCIALAALSILISSTFASYAATDADEPLSLRAGLLSRQDEVGRKAQLLAQEAAVAYASKDYAKAIRLYGEAIQLVPRDAQLLYNRGNASYMLGELDRALADFSEAISLAPNYYLALMNRGNIYSRRSHFENALADYNKAIQSNPGDFLIFYNRGVAYKRLGRLSEAVVDLNEAIRLKPDDAQSYAIRGEVFQKQGDPAAASADLARASTLTRSATAVILPPGQIGSPPRMAVEPLLKEHIVLLKSSCWDNGEDETGLKALAAQSNWFAVGDAELRRRSYKATVMIGGWTFVSTLGDAAVIQSRSTFTASVYVCSLTTQLSEPATESVIKSMFEAAFETSSDETIERPTGSEFRYWLPHRPGCDSRVSLIFLRHSNAFTVRMLHGRTREQSHSGQYVE